MLKEIKSKHAHYFVDEFNNRQGEFKKYFHDGSLDIHCFFVNNIRHGEYKEWCIRNYKYSVYRHEFFVNGESFSFDKIPHPGKIPEDRMYFTLKYGIPLLPVEGATC